MSVTSEKLELLTISSDVLTNLEFRISKLLLQIFVKIYFSTGELRQKSYFENKKFAMGVGWEVACAHAHVRFVVTRCTCFGTKRPEIAIFRTFYSVLEHPFLF